MKILNLTLYRKWFDEIASGKKTEEYRSMIPYWTTRLLDNDFDEVHFRNGYGNDAPFMRVEFKGLDIRNKTYVIKLGKVLEVRNGNTPKRSI